MIWKVTPTPIQKGFGTINYIVLIVYLLIMVGVGFYFAGKIKVLTIFLGGVRRWYGGQPDVVFFATMLSSLTFTGLPGKAYATDWVYFIANMMIPVVAFVAVYVALPFTEKLMQPVLMSTLKKDSAEK